VCGGVASRVWWWWGAVLCMTFRARPAPPSCRRQQLKLCRTSLTTKPWTSARPGLSMRGGCRVPSRVPRVRVGCTALAHAPCQRVECVLVGARRLWALVSRPPLPRARLPLVHLSCAMPAAWTPTRRARRPLAPQVRAHHAPHHIPWRARARCGAALLGSGCEVRGVAHTRRLSHRAVLCVLCALGMYCSSCGQQPRRLATSRSGQWDACRVRWR